MGLFIWLTYFSVNQLCSTSLRWVLGFGLVFLVPFHLIESNSFLESSNTDTLNITREMRCIISLGYV